MKRLIALLLLALTLCPRALAQPPYDADRLVIYTSHKPEVYEPIIREFESRTGLWVVLESGGTEEMLDRIAREADAPACDLMFGGGVESLNAYRVYFAEHPLEGLALDEASSKWLPFSSLPIVMIYNPKLTKAPDGWHDLTDEKWRGRIAFADPSVSGSSYTALATLLQIDKRKNVLEQFFHNLDGQILQGSGDVVGAVASGRALIGVTLEETALKGVNAGYDIEMVYPSEGTSAVPDGVALVAGGPHPQNAELFLAFILSDDVQNRLSTKFYRRSVLDEPTEFTQIDYDIEWASEQKAATLAAWALLRGEGQP